MSAAGQESRIAGQEARIRVESDGPTVTITLARPERRNALDAAMVSQLVAAFEGVEADPNARAVMLTAAPPVFCAGSDVAELAAAAPAARGAMEGFWTELEEAVHACPVPVIAVIAGGAWGGGLFLATYADIRVAADDARFAAPEVALGWIPPGGIEALIDLIGLGTATDLLLTSRTIDATEAQRIGLVERVVPAASLADAADEIARTIGTHPPAGIRSTKRYLRERMRLERAERDRLALELFTADALTEDAETSLARFIKR